MRLSSFVFLAAVLVSVAPVQAQMGAGGQTSLTPSFTGAARVRDLASEPSGPGWALLDPSRFHMRQSYSISYMSGSGGSGSMGLYLNEMEYQLFEPLTLHVGLGYLHQPFGSRGANSGGASISDGFFVPDVGLEYRPSENFLMMVDFRQIPAGASPYGWGWGSGYGVGSRYWYDPWRY